MLNPASTEIIKATLPVVGAAVDDITKVFYRRMFDAHPELERQLFNRGNQAQGTQQRALAAAIAGYATLLVGDGPEPGEVLARIAHKHASLGIAPEQYPIVHEHLFAAIVQVLGAAVTPEVAAAWDEVYWLMANTLIDMEAGLYAEAGVTPQTVWRELVVTERHQQSPGTVSFTLASHDGTALPAAKPGQYVSIGCHLPDGSRQIRQYSLVGRPEAGSLRISVKAVAGDEQAPEGEVSNFLHAEIFEGDTLEVSAPFGELTLTEADTPLVLISAGIGITPMLGFLDHLHRSGSTREVLVLHADRSQSDHAHRAQLQALVELIPGASLHRWYERLGTRTESDQILPGRIDLSRVSVPADADYYLCGPLPFMAQVRTELLAHGADDARIHYEVFGPSQQLEQV